MSSNLVPMIRFERRASTAVADAYLSPLIQEYLARFQKGFAAGGGTTRISFMMSDGGLCPVQRFTGFKVGGCFFGTACSLFESCTASCRPCCRAPLAE